MTAETETDTNSISMSDLEKNDHTCMICLEQGSEDTAVAKDGLLLLRVHSDCPHHVCRPCLKTYLLCCENERKASAICPDPDCETIVTMELAKEILGREYTWTTPAATKTDTGAPSPDPEKDQDQDLIKWLQENEARNCGHCGAWIVREDGCDTMQCLCGWRFCYLCREDAEDGCGCGHSEGDFYDNILDLEGAAAPDLATDEDLQKFAEFCHRRLEDYAENL